jgi:hypothetical protein
MVQYRSENPLSTQGLVTRIEQVDKSFPIDMTGFGKNPKFQEIEILKFMTLEITGGLLGILQLKKLQTISRPASIFGKNMEIISAFHCIEDHLKDKNILACQEQMIDNGLKDYAEL